MFDRLDYGGHFLEHGLLYEYRHIRKQMGPICGELPREPRFTGHVIERVCQLRGVYRHAKASLVELVDHRGSVEFGGPIAASHVHSLRYMLTARAFYGTLPGGVGSHLGVLDRAVYSEPHRPSINDLTSRDQAVRQ